METSEVIIIDCGQRVNLSHYGIPSLINFQFPDDAPHSNQSYSRRPTGQNVAGIMHSQVYPAKPYQDR